MVKRPATTKTVSARAKRAAAAVLRNPASSKAAKTARGEALSQRPKTPCVKCGKPGRHSWSGCCVNGASFWLCDKHDLEINGVFLKFLGISNWKEVIRRYKQVRG